VRAALARPARPVVTRASASTTAPIPATSHQAGLVADANPAANEPCRLAVRIEPTTATPSDEPTWRLVEAIPAAVPARARGIPATALLVIGAFTQPMPMPSTRQLSSTYQTGEAPVMKTSMIPPMVMPVPAISSGVLGPLRASSRPHSGAETAIATAIGSRNRPATSGRYPRTSCR
jgi:hypothetical protein